MKTLWCIFTGLGVSCLAASAIRLFQWLFVSADLGWLFLVGGVIFLIAASVIDDHWVLE